MLDETLIDIIRYNTKYLIDYIKDIIFRRYPNSKEFSEMSTPLPLYYSIEINFIYQKIHDLSIIRGKIHNFL